MSEKGIDEMVGSCSVWDGYTFDPLSYIRAVNVLRKNDKSFLVDALTKYVESSDRALVPESTKVFFLLRLLFEPDDPKTSFPVIKVGSPLDDIHSAVGDFPIYPLVLINDVPLLFVPGFFLGGLPENPVRHIEFCENSCHVRSSPLIPPDKPLSLADLLMSSKNWYRQEIRHDRGVLRGQLLRLVKNVYPVPGIFESTFYDSLIQDEIWENYKREFDSLNAIWDQKENDYCLKE